MRHDPDVAGLGELGVRSHISFFVFVAGGRISGGGLSYHR
jgi:hypothetical protein